METDNKERELNIAAKVDNLQPVLDYVDGILEEAACPIKTQMQIDVAVEEIFVNIASYAYGENDGEARVTVLVTDDNAVHITFYDSGVQYDPLAKEDPDITLSAQERQIGGLGVFMTKKLMDDVSYEYANGYNVLKLVKKL